METGLASARAFYRRFWKLRNVFLKCSEKNNFYILWEKYLCDGIKSGNIR